MSIKVAMVIIAANGSMFDFIQRSDGMTGTTYGWGEKMCGDIGKPVPCDKNATTASGHSFDPELPTAAIAAPTRLRMPKEGFEVYLKVEGGECSKILVNDKKNPRFIDKKPWDLTKGALKALGVDPTRHWSGKVFICTEEEIVNFKEKGVSDE